MEGAVMINIYNKSYETGELRKRVGNLYQIGGTRHYELTEGNSRGTRAIDVNTGAGLCFTVLPDRGMDISLASYKGVNLVYQTPNGEVNPSFYNPAGVEWLKVFFAGLLTTCGLTYLGPPGEDNGVKLGLHGRHTAIPAKKVCDMSLMDENGYNIHLTGVIEDSTLFGEKIIMKRTIRSRIASKSLTIHDEVENYGASPSPFTILYHINFGFPLLDECSKILVKSEKVEPYDEVSRSGMDRLNSFEAPSANYREQNFLYYMKADNSGYAYAAVINKELMGGIGVYIKFKADTLPYLSEWKMAGEIDYVLALEPCNTKCENRKVLREKGLLPILNPHEKREMEVEIGVIEGENEISKSESKLMV